MPHRFIGCEFLVALHPKAFECLCICGLSRLNDNYKVLIAFQLGPSCRKGWTHTPYNHAKKLNNVARSQPHKCGLKKFRCVLQIILEPIPLQECMPPSSNNGVLFIVTKMSQGVVQDPHIHGRMILNLRAFFPNRWVSGLTWLHNHIMVCL